MTKHLRRFALAGLLCIATLAHAAPRAVARCPDVPMPEWTADNAAMDAQFEKVSPLATALAKPDRLAQLLSDGQDPNRCIYSVSILSMAATLGRTEAARQLLAAGAKVDRPLSADGDSALLHALSMAHFELAELLLDRGANVRRKTTFGTTALHALAMGFVPAPHASPAAVEAAGKAQLRVAQRLIAGGAPIDTRDGQRRTPLLLAAVFGRTELVRLLLDHGADPRATNRRGETALAIADRKGNAVMAELLRSRSR